MRFAPKRVRLGFTVVVAMATMVKDRTQVTVFEIGPATDEALITGETVRKALALSSRIRH